MNKFEKGLYYVTMAMIVILIPMSIFELIKKDFVDFIISILILVTDFINLHNIKKGIDDAGDQDKVS